MGEWEMVRLGDVGVFQTGGTPSRNKSDYFEGSHPWVTTPSLGSTYIDDSNANAFLTDEAINSSATKIIPANSLLIGIRVGVGKSSINSVPICTNQDIVSISKIDTSKVSLEYLHKFLATQQNYLNSQKRGATIQGIKTETLKELQISLPPLDVQKKIADILDQVTDLIEKRKAQITKLDLLVKPQFIEMFGDPVTNPMGWETKSLCKLGELNRGVSKHRPRNDPKLLGGKYPLIQTGEVANADLYLTTYSSTYSKTGYQQSKMWPKGTLCITIAANIAKTAILDFDSCFPDSIVGFVPGEHTNQLFMHYWFSFFQELLEKQAPQSAQRNINLQILRNIEVTVPPIDLQNRFANFVTETEQSKVKMQQGLDKLELLYKSLMQKCFGGANFEQ
ncbi:MAG: restriction endonuclease subunit S [Oscillospiraceae bacterium]|nr:restriction endonuclease subunit S [Oscillospiraceae bacterium]